MVKDDDLLSVSQHRGFVPCACPFARRNHGNKLNFRVHWILRFACSRFDLQPPSPFQDSAFTFHSYHISFGRSAMKSTVVLLLIISLISLDQGCAPNGNPISQLGTPMFVPQSPPDSVIESGIGEDAGNRYSAICLQWYSTLGAARYKVYRTDTTDANKVPINFGLITNVISTSSLNDTSAVDANAVAVGVRYYYYLVAYSTNGTLSSPSDTINYTLLNRPELFHPGNNSQLSGSTLYFGWHDYEGGGYTVIRVKDISALPSKYIWVSRRFQVFDTYPIESFNFDSVATSQVVSGHSYQWRVDRFNLDGSGRAYQGSRSTWSTFTVQ